MRLKKLCRRPMGRRRWRGSHSGDVISGEPVAEIDSTGVDSPARWIMRGVLAASLCASSRSISGRSGSRRLPPC